MIPKFIYQTWKTKELPLAAKVFTDKMKELNPEYKHIIFNDEEIDSFVKENYSKQVFDIYDSLQLRVARADLWRYMFLYKNGGIYLDIDSSINRSLRELIVDSDRAIVTREKNPGLFVQWCLMFEANHPILEAVIKKALENVYLQTSSSVVELTGPVVFSNVLKKHFADVDIYLDRDEDVNKITNIKGKNSVRFFGYDYEDFCTWKVSEIDRALHMNEIHWREEAETKSIFK